MEAIRIVLIIFLAITIVLGIGMLYCYIQIKIIDKAIKRYEQRVYEFAVADGKAGIDHYWLYNDSPKLQEIYKDGYSKGQEVAE